MKNSEEYLKHIDRLKEFEEVIGYVFSDKSLLFQALSHSSFANDLKTRTGEKHFSNERLEFLGDSVLSIVVSEHLFRYFSHLPEGDLSRIRAALVCEQTLFEFSHRIRLGEFLFLSRGEEMNGGRTRPSTVSDAFEAVIGALYLDGGLENARKYVTGFIPKNLNKDTAKKLGDHKTLLQEVIQQNPEERVEYVTVGESGPEHNKMYRVNVLLNGAVIGSGEGHTKKQAEQQAAREALILMGELK